MGLYIRLSCEAITYYRVRAHSMAGFFCRDVRLDNRSMYGICSPPLEQRDSDHYVLQIKHSAEQDSASWKRSGFVRRLWLNEMPTLVVCCLFPSAANRVMVKYIFSI